MIVTMLTFSKFSGPLPAAIGRLCGGRGPTLFNCCNKVRQPFNVTRFAAGVPCWRMGTCLSRAAARSKTNAEGIAYLEREFNNRGPRSYSEPANFILVEVGTGKTVFYHLRSLA